VAIFDEGVDLAGEQINSSQQAERAMAFVFMVARKGGPGRQAWAANPVMWLRSPGYLASRRRRRSLPACAICLTFSSPWPRPS
jgi:hypothetical protein